MKKRSFCFVAGVTALVAVAQGQVAPNTALASNKTVKQAWTPPRTADGHPDFQGFWANNNATPMERPKELAGRATLTDEEVAAMKKKAEELYNGKGDAAFGDTIFETVWASLKGTASGPHKKADNEFDSGTGDYSSEWIVQRDWDNRTSLITDPPDGRMPALTPEGQKRRSKCSKLCADRPEGQKTEAYPNAASATDRRNSRPVTKATTKSCKHPSR